LVDGNGSKNDHHDAGHSVNTLHQPQSNPNQRTLNMTVHRPHRESSPHNDSDQENMAPPVETTQRRYHLRSRSRRTTTSHTVTDGAIATTSNVVNAVSARSRGTKRRREREDMTLISPPSSSETTSSDQMHSKQDHDATNTVKLECGRTHSSSIWQSTMTPSTLKRESANSVDHSTMTSRRLSGDIKGEHAENPLSAPRDHSHHSTSYRFPANFEPKTKKIKLDPTVTVTASGSGGGMRSDSVLSAGNTTTDLPVLGEMNTSSTPFVHGNAVYPQLLHRNQIQPLSSNQSALDMDTVDGYSLRLLLQHLFPSFPSAVDSPPVTLGQSFGATMPALHTVTGSTSSGTSPGISSDQVPGTRPLGTGTSLDVNMQYDPLSAINLMTGAHGHGLSQQALTVPVPLGGGNQIHRNHGTDLITMDPTVLVQNWNSRSVPGVPLNVFNANNVGSGTPLDALGFGAVSTAPNITTTSGSPHSAVMDDRRCPELERLADYVIDDYNRNRESLG